MWREQPTSYGRGFDEVGLTEEIGPDHFHGTVAAAVMARQGIPGEPANTPPEPCGSHFLHRLGTRLQRVGRRRQPTQTSGVLRWNAAVKRDDRGTACSCIGSLAARLPTRSPRFAVACLLGALDADGPERRAANLEAHVVDQARTTLVEAAPLVGLDDPVEREPR